MRISELGLLLIVLSALVIQHCSAVQYIDACTHSYPNIMVDNSTAPSSFDATLESPTRFEVSHFSAKNVRSPNGMLFGSKQVRLTPTTVDSQLYDLFLAQAVVPGMFNNSEGDLLLHYRPASGKGGSDSKQVTFVLPLKGVHAGEHLDTHVERTLENLLGLTTANADEVGKDSSATSSAHSTGHGTSSHGSTSSSSAGTTTSSRAKAKPHIFNPFQFIESGDHLLKFQAPSALFPCNNDTSSGMYFLHHRTFSVLLSTIDFIRSVREAHADYSATPVSNATVMATLVTANVVGSHLPKPDAPSAAQAFPANSTVGGTLTIKHHVQGKMDDLALQAVATGLGAGAACLFVYAIVLIIQRQKMYCHWYEPWPAGQAGSKVHGKERAPLGNNTLGHDQDEDDDEYYDDGDSYDQSED